MDTATPPPEGRRLTAILLAVCLASFATPFISSGVQIALPLIAAAFGVPATLLGWVPTAFLLPYAVFLLPFGKTADMFGRRRYFLMGIAIMGTGLICAGLTPSFGFLMAGMAIAGFGSAMTFATALPLLTTNYPLRERGKIIGINTAVVYVSLAAGPFFGGIITGFLGWRALFLVTAPFILAALAVGYSVIPKDLSAAKRAFDYPGTIIYGVSLILLIGGASRLPALWAAGIALTGACGLAGFFLWEARADDPIFPVRLLRGNRAFTYSNIAALINYSSTYAVTFLLSLYLQYVRALTPQTAGTILLAQPVLMAITSPLAGRLSDRTEPRILATAGMAIVTACLFLLSFIGKDTPFYLIIAVLVILGLGYGIFSPPNMNSIMSSVGNAQAGIASATAATMRVLGQNLSMAIAMIAFSFVIGTVVITPDRTGELLTATHYAFVAFGILCAAGVWFSAVRGNIRDSTAEQPK